MEFFKSFFFFRRSAAETRAFSQDLTKIFLACVIFSVSGPIKIIQRRCRIPWPAAGPVRPAYNGRSTTMLITGTEGCLPIQKNTTPRPAALSGGRKMQARGSRYDNVAVSAPQDGAASGSWRPASPTRCAPTTLPARFRSCAARSSPGSTRLSPGRRRPGCC